MIIKKLKAEIAKIDTPANQVNYQQFFKEKLDKPIGLKTAPLRKISNQVYREIKGKSKKDILNICDQLLASSERYMRFFAFEWAQKTKEEYTPSDFPRFERWLKNHVDNWGACDHLCCGALGHLIAMYPDLAVGAQKWVKSKNRWLRRASAVCLIVSLRNGRLLDQAFRIADILLLDDDDMVQKGYGWMLKVAADGQRDDVFAYVLKHKDVMPRTALRYAIEKMPQSLRKQAMAK